MDMQAFAMWSGTVGKSMSRRGLWPGSELQDDGAGVQTGDLHQQVALASVQVLSCLLGWQGQDCAVKVMVGI